MADYTTNEYERVIRSSIMPRNVLIQKSATPGSLANFSSSRSVTTRTVGGVGGAVSGVSNTVTDQRKSEKRALQDLNERFAGYIEKVRFLEAQNRKLGDELENLKSKWGKQTTIIKTIYQTDLDQVQNLLNESEKDTSRLQIQVASLEEKIDELRRKLEEANRAVNESRDKVEKQLHQVSELESEVHLLRMRSDLLDGDKRHNKALITQLQEALNRAKSNYDAQVHERDAAEARRISLEEELAFLKELHEQELRELATKINFDSTSMNREMWKSEMGSELKKMQEVYGDKIDEMMNEMNLNYTLQVQSLNLPRPQQTGTSKDETIRIRTQTNEIRQRVQELEDRNKQLLREIEDLRHDKEDRENELEKDIGELRENVITMRAEMEAINRELESLMDAKLGLEIEIAAYRKLLEGEQNEEGLRHVVDSMFDNLVAAGNAGSNYDMGGGYGGGFGGGSGGGFGVGGGSSGFGGGSGVGGGSAGGVGGGGSGFGGGAGGGGNSFGGGSSGAEISSGFSTSKGGSSGGVVGGRTSYQRSAKGPVTINECDSEGKFIVIENTGKRIEDMGGFTIKRTVDNKDIPVYSFKSNAVLEPRNKLKLWAKGMKPIGAGAGDIETDLATWGKGANITTLLINPSGQDRASHVQKTLQ